MVPYSVTSRLAEVLLDILLLHIVFSCNNMMLIWVSSLPVASFLCSWDETFHGEVEAVCAGQPCFQAPLLRLGSVYNCVWASNGGGAFLDLTLKMFLLLLIEEGKCWFLFVSEQGTFLSPLLLVSANSGVTNATGWCQRLYKFWTDGRPKCHFSCK